MVFFYWEEDEDEYDEDEEDEDEESDNGDFVDYYFEYVLFFLVK